MLLDLVRALLAAVLVGVLPGYFWARVLSASSDPAERLALSAALSITLVPATILIPARIFGTGVTLAATISCALLVLVAGVAVYLRFGPAKGPNEPLAPPPVPLGAPALVLLLPALGLALVLAFGLSYEFFVFVRVGVDAWYAAWILPTIALLLVFAAAVQAILSRRNAPEEAPPDLPAEAGHTVTRYLLLSSALALVLVRGYVGPVLLEWPFIRGVDHYSHDVMADLMMTRGTVESYLVYPPGFHTMTAMVSRLSGLEPLEVFPVLAPALLALPPLALYVLASRLWGWQSGVAAALISGLLVGGSYHYFEDAMYPNLVAAQFLLVLALSALFWLCDAPSARGGVLLALLGSAVVLYHPVASMYEALLLAAISLSFLPYLLLRDRRRGLALFPSLALLFVISVFYAWDTYDLPQTVAGLLGGPETGRGGEAIGMAVGTQLPFRLESLFATVSLPVLLFGVLGALLLATGRWRRGGTPYALARVTLFAWCFLLFVGSRTSLSAFPQRFERDLGIPLALLAAFALVAVLRSVGWRKPLALLAAGLTAVLGLYGAQISFSDAAAPSWRLVMTPPIAEAGDWLEEHNEGGNILVSPHLWNQVPSRMMLAMGDYSALQSFDEGQLRVPRDLPPTGAGPPRDILWVLYHPEGERTQEILEKYDVRYIVLYKNFPNRGPVEYWKLFEACPDLYRIALQNRDVVILDPR